MQPELIFKVILIVIYSLFSIIRILYQILAKRAGYRTVIEESKRYSILLGILICYEVFTLFLYLLYPGSMQWASLDLPLWIQWAGVFLGIAALILFIWVHQNLGKNFSRKLRIADRQALVETGPYTLVRHPMYTAFYVLHLAAFMTTMNWFIGITWIVGLTIILVLRVTREEAMMIDRFGEQYISYMKRTGRFVPQIRLWKLLAVKN